MAEQRALFYDLRDVNATVGKAYEEVPLTNTITAQIDLNEHSRLVYKIIRDTYYTE